jgi:hypothetical protein
MRVLFSGLVLSTLVVTTGCERESPRAALTEDYLKRDLQMALTAYHAQNQPLELNDGAVLDMEPELMETPRAAAPRTQPASAPARQVQRQAPVARSQPAPQPRVVTQTNSRRDAAIGAGVGAAAGAIIHKPNRVKGAIVGGVIGGAAGAVVGATIDKKTTIVYH